jgi:hypothetical protein
MTAPGERRDTLDGVIDRVAAHLIAPADDPDFRDRLVASLPNRRNGSLWRWPLPAWQIGAALLAVAATSLYVNRPRSEPRLPATEWADVSPLVRAVPPALPAGGEDSTRAHRRAAFEAFSRASAGAPTAVVRRNGPNPGVQRRSGQPDWGVLPLAPPAALALETMDLGQIDLAPVSVAPLEIGELTVDALSVKDFEE